MEEMLAGDDEEKPQEEPAEEEDEDDEEKKEDEGDGRPRGKPPPYYVFSGDEYNEKGNYMDIEGTKVYAVGEKTQVGILMAGDLYGWSEGRLKEIADYIAVAAHARVVLPRLLDTPCFENGNEGDGLPLSVDPLQRKQEFKTWIMKYTFESFKPKLQSAIAHLRSGGAKRIGGIGFGFGAWICAKMCTQIGEWQFNALLYPEIERFETINGMDVDVVAGKMRGTTFFMLSGEDPRADRPYRERGIVYEKVLENNPGTETQTFSDQKKGWALRGDAGVPGIRPATEKAVLFISKMLRKFLWPAPPGFNAQSLRTAARNGDADQVEALIASGVACTGPDALDTVGLTPMHYAAREGHPMPIKALIEGEADPNEHGGIGEETPLHVAALMGRQKAVKELIHMKCELEPMDKSSQVPLHYAAKEGQTAVVKLLIQSEASIGPVDTSGQTPLHLAAYNGKQQVCILLMRAKMDCDPEDLRVKTPQKRALEMGFQACADIFQNVREQREAEAAQAAAAAAAAAAAEAAAAEEAAKERARKIKGSGKSRLRGAAP